MTKHLFYASLIFCPLLMLQNCATAPQQAHNDCDVFTDSLISTISRHSHFDPSLQRIKDQPYLRSNRFLANFNPEIMTENQYDAWLIELKTVAVQNYQIELARIPQQEKNKLLSATQFVSIENALTACSRISRLPQRLTKSQVAVNDNYSTAQRLFGLYPISSRVAQSSIEKYRSDMAAKVADGYSQQFAQEKFYQPHKKFKPTIDKKLSFANIETWIRAARALHPLGIPELSATKLQELFAVFAPQVQVEFKDHHDLIGSVEFDQETEKIILNHEQPIIYTYPSYTRWKKQLLLQLNYAFWFAGRPAEADFDLYAGELDGLIWRITLSNQGKPLLFDSIHQCGCYHKLFLPPGISHDFSELAGEKPLVFTLREYQQLSPVGLRLKLEAATHYIVDVGLPKTEQNTLPYHFAAYERLLQLPIQPTAESIFGDTGIIRQSARPERWLLWPLGVPNAGAMRQRGMHATAFIGMRHFDEPYLLELLGIKNSHI